MAKAKEVVGLDCSADVHEWTTEILRVRFEEVVEWREAALNFDDIEGVHNMRVATRRLRSAVRDFLPFLDKRSLKRVRRDLKQIADALGRVRDQDVAVAALEKLQSGIEEKEIKKGFELLLAKRRDQRDRARQNLSETITVDHLAKVQNNFGQAVAEAASPKNKKNAQSDGNHKVSFNAAGKIVVGQSLQEFLALSASLYRPFEIEELHELRIAAKRLRYGIELYTICWGAKVASFAEEVAKMQSFLGEVHDADVWIEDLGERLRANAFADQVEVQASIWLLSEFAKSRSKNYRAALNLWSEWQTNNFAEKLRNVISGEV